MGNCSTTRPHEDPLACRATCPLSLVIPRYPRMPESGPWVQTPPTHVRAACKPHTDHCSHLQSPALYLLLHPRRSHGGHLLQALTGPCRGFWEMPFQRDSAAAMPSTTLVVYFLLYLLSAPSSISHEHIIRITILREKN